MEMPEGWKRLMHQTEEMREGARLMKEMAEALEIEEKAYLEAKLNKNQVSPILKKFKEWK